MPTSTINAFPITTTTIDSLTVFSGSVDGAQDLIPYWQHSSTTTEGISRNQFLNIISQPVGISDSLTISNKINDNTNSFTIKDGSLTFQNTADTTKRVVFSLTGITTATTRTLSLPNATDTLVGRTTTDTLTNKTLTSPTINNAIVSNPTLTVDSISGFTISTIVSVAGLSISNGVLNTNNSVKTTNYQNASVTADKLSTGTVVNTIATSQTTASAVFVDLGTVGPTVTATIGANGLALLTLTHHGVNSGANSNLMGYAASGANTIAVADAVSAQSGGTLQLSGSTSLLLTGLTPGATTFTAKYRTTGGTATFLDRSITVVPL